jgi:hypothetical protein
MIKISMLKHTHPRYCFWRRCSQQIRNYVKLMHHIFPREKRLSSQQFCKYTSNTPYIYRWCILHNIKNSLGTSSAVEKMKYVLFHSMNKEQDLVTKQEPHVTSHNKKEGKTEVYLTALSDGIYKNVFSPSL